MGLQCLHVSKKAMLVNLPCVSLLVMKWVSHISITLIVHRNWSWWTFSEYHIFLSE